jgi:hypothetical protein
MAGAFVFADPITDDDKLYPWGIPSVVMAITKCLFSDSEIDTASLGRRRDAAAIVQLRADVEGRLIGQRMPDACF